MAIYHCSIKIISRGKGKSAVAAAAYRAGEKITNAYDGITHDYTRKGGIAQTEILLPENAPAEYADRDVLWNAVEQIEKAKNARLAREIELALPMELTKEQNISLVRRYVKEQFVSTGMCADICLHDKDGSNPHAHILLTTRPFEMNGAWGAKAHKENGVKIPTVDWNDGEKAELWRSAWADAVNASLGDANIEIRIDHRSYERQGIEQIPAIHLGVAAFQMEKRGIATERGNINREIEVTNRHLRQLRARINHAKDWLKSEAASTPQPLWEILDNILQSGRNDGYWKKAENLKAASQMLIFLQQNKIEDMAALSAKVDEMQGRFYGMRENFKKTERRLGTLKEHIEQAEYYLEFKDIHKKYRQMNPKYQKDFREVHHREISLYKSAERYLRDVMNGHTKLPLKAWKAEQAKLTAEKDSLYADYHRLKDEIQKVETIKRNVERLIREETPRQNISRGAER